MSRFLRLLGLALGTLLFFACDIADTWRVLFLPTGGEGVEVASLVSENTGTEYAIYVGLPDSYAADTTTTYPVIFLLDGDSSFTDTRSRALALAADGIMAEALLVGVGYGDAEDMRTRDYTPTAMEGVATDSGEASGGASAFLAFLTDELLPWVEARYRISAERALRGIAGHSYGGLFAFFALFNASDSFGAFIASSPTLAWDELVSFSYVDAWAASGRPTSAALFTSSGAGDGFPADALIDVMADRVEAVSGAAPTVAYYPNTVHANVWRDAFPDGMAALFPGGAQ
jgi:predicted alpha/beta superfamily hydrolase